MHPRTGKVWLVTLGAGAGSAEAVATGAGFVTGSVAGEWFAVRNMEHPERAAAVPATASRRQAIVGALFFTMLIPVFSAW